MAELPDDEKEAIIKRDLPGYKLRESAGAPRAAAAADTRGIKPEAGTPDIDELRKKYFGDDDSDASDSSETAGRNLRAGISRGVSTSDNDDEIVTVEPENRVDAWDRGSRPKSVVISSSKKKIIGSQG